jgi:serine/threonine-protein phosphatase 6 regulatory ankyrin repeat subunit B
VVEGQTPRVLNFLRMGVDLDETGSSDLTALHRAVLSGHGDLLEPLIQAGADVNAISDDFGTPLCLAALKGMDEAVSILLKCRAKADATTKKVGTPLHCCILSLGDHTTTLTALMNAGARVTTQATVDTQWLHVICGWDGDDRTRKSSPQDVNGCILHDATPAFVAVRSLRHDLLQTLLPPDPNHAFHITFLDAKGGRKSGSKSPRIRQLQALENRSKAFDSLRHTYLSSCATTGNIDGVKILIAKGAKLDLDLETVIMPLMTAARFGHTDIATILLEGGASVDRTGSWGRTALHWAASGGSTDIVRLLCERGADIDAADDGGRTALYSVAHRENDNVTDGHRQVVSTLCECGATVDAQANDGSTALQRAARNGLRKIVCLLCDRGAMIDNRDDDGWTALHYAASQEDTDGHRQIVKTLCERGATVDAQTNSDSTALHLAARDGLGKIVCLLCDRGATIDMKDANGRTALHEAANAGDHRVVRTLCERGAMVDDRDNRGCTPLWHAARKHSKQRDSSCCDDAWYISRILVDAGANVNARNDSGRTPLLIMLRAVDKIDVAILDKLVRAGAETSARDNNGLSVLRLCFLKPFANAVVTTVGKALRFDDATIERVYAQMESVCQDSKNARKRSVMLIHRSANDGSEDLRLLIALGADVDIESVESGTALHSAARRDNCDAIDRLVAANASLESFDCKGRTPLAVAVRYQRTQAVRGLIRHGSDPRAKGPGSDARSALEIATKQRDRTILIILNRTTEMLSSSGSES